MGQEAAQEILDLMARWRDRSVAGDVDALLDMLADDVVFLTHGNAPFGKKEFEAGFRKFSAAASMELDHDVREVYVSGDLAYALSHLRVTTKPRQGGAGVTNEGDILTVFRKSGGRWRLARDANLMPQAGNPEKK
jgi:uncharacterized protein (TIGR02246 family)